MHSSDGRVEMFSFDFGAHWPTEGHKILVETGTTQQIGLPKFQPARSTQSKGMEHSLLDRLLKSTKIGSNTEIKS